MDNLTLDERQIYRAKDKEKKSSGRRVLILVLIRVYKGIMDQRK